MARRICVVVLSRANYGRCRSIIQAAQNDPEVELQLVVGASAIDHLHGNVADVIRAEGFPVAASVDFLLSSSSPLGMATTTGLGIVKLASCFDVLRPDVVVTIADRYETMATAIAASYQNICLAHVQGGEITGSIDESVRHAITKLAHVHFPATKMAARNVVAMGEDRRNVHLVGCPAMDQLFETKSEPLDISNLTGVGFEINGRAPYYLVIYHPVTSEYGESDPGLEELITTITELNVQTVWLWPNADAGSDSISKRLRIWREQHKPKVRFIKNLPVEEYNKLLDGASCAVGNSSSFIREASILATPAVLIGSRQNERELAANAIRRDDYPTHSLKDLINKQAQSKPDRSSLYGDGMAGKKIIDVLKGKLPSTQKLLTFEG